MATALGAMFVWNRSGRSLNWTPNLGLARERSPPGSPPLLSSARCAAAVASLPRALRTAPTSWTRSVHRRRRRHLASDPLRRSELLTRPQPARCGDSARLLERIRDDRRSVRCWRAETLRVFVYVHDHCSTTFAAHRWRPSSPARSVLVSNHDSKPCPAAQSTCRDASPGQRPRPGSGRSPRDRLAQAPRSITGRVRATANPVGRVIRALPPSHHQRTTLRSCPPSAAGARIRGARAGVKLIATTARPKDLDEGRSSNRT